MHRLARIAKLRAESVDAYARLHETVWPEVRAAIAEAGVRNYTIFRHDVWLFSYFELPEEVTLPEVTAAMTASSVCQRWEAEMRALRDPTFAADWLPMTEVFHQDGEALSLPELSAATEA